MTQKSRHSTTGHSILLPQKSTTAIVIGVALAALSGCTGQQDPPAVPATAVPTEDAQASAEREVLAAYRGLLAAYAAAGATANANDPRLADHAADEALRTLQSGLAQHARDGEVLKGEYRSKPTVSELVITAVPRTAEISDCLDDTDFLAYTAAGTPVDEQRGGPRATTATATQTGDATWKITVITIGEVGTC